MTIYYHKHHIVPKHMGGSDDPTNIIEITVEEHAQIHKVLWEQNGFEQDKIAWLALSGQITNQEAIRKTVSLSNRNRLADGTHHLLSGKIQRKAALERIAKGTHNDKELKEKVTCPHCNKSGQKFVMRRWHFDNCKHQLKKSMTIFFTFSFSYLTNGVYFSIFNLIS